MEEDNIIVPTNIAYSSCLLKNNIEQLKKRYNFIRSGNIGYSVLDKPIPYIRIGTGTKEVMYSSSIHANEWITSVVLMKFVEDFARSYENNDFIYGYSAREIFNNTTIYIIPMVNPDGVDLVTGVIPENTGIYNNFKDISLKFPNIPFPSGWKANFNGVDLKNFQPFSKVLYMFNYTTLRVFSFSFIISSILINSSRFSLIEFSLEKLKYMYIFLSLSISILFINLYKNILSGFSNFKKFSINSSNSFSSFV